MSRDRSEQEEARIAQTEALRDARVEQEMGKYQEWLEGLSTEELQAELAKQQSDVQMFDEYIQAAEYSSSLPGGIIFTEARRESDRANAYTRELYNDVISPRVAELLGEQDARLMQENPQLYALMQQTEGNSRAIRLGYSLGGTALLGFLAGPGGLIAGGLGTYLINNDNAYRNMQISGNFDQIYAEAQAKGTIAEEFIQQRLQEESGMIENTLDEAGIGELGTGEMQLEGLEGLESLSNSNQLNLFIQALQIIMQLATDKDFMGQLNNFMKENNLIDGPIIGEGATAGNLTNEELASEVWQGKWGNGQERIDKLTEAGYDYRAVQDIVNERQPNTISNDNQPTEAKEEDALVAEEVNLEEAIYEGSNIDSFAASLGVEKEEESNTLDETTINRDVEQEKDDETQQR